MVRMPTKLNDTSCQLSLMIRDNDDNNNTSKASITTTDNNRARRGCYRNYYWLLLFGGSRYYDGLLLNCASKACLGVWIRQCNPVLSWVDWQKEAEMWSNECRKRRGSQRTTYELHTSNIDWETANKLLEMQSCTPPHGEWNAKYWYLRDVSTQLDWYCDADCNGTSPTLTRLIVTETSWRMSTYGVYIIS